MVETPSDELSSRQQDTRRVRRKSVKFGYQGCPLLPGHPTVQHERGRHLAIQGGPDRVEVLGALGQHQHRAAQLEGSRDLGSDGLHPGLVIRQVPEYILYPRFRRQVDA